MASIVSLGLFVLLLQLNAAKQVAQVEQLFCEDVFDVVL